jgi:ribosomal protein S18 acetylase RimI-like enzyme
MITRLGAEYVSQVAALHQKTLTGLLARLGTHAIAAYYTGCVKSDLAIGLVDVEDGIVRGFVLGSMHPERLNGEAARKNPFGVALSVAAGVAAHPSSMPLLLQSIRGTGGDDFDRHAPSLVYLAVDPRARRAAVGRSVVNAFGERLRMVGAKFYDVSVDDDNAPAIAFYERLGFRVTGTYREFGTLHRRYRVTLA